MPDNCTDLTLLTRSQMVVEAGRMVGGGKGGMDLTLRQHMLNHSKFSALSVYRANAVVPV